jgi:hypothetical protein
MDPRIYDLVQLREVLLNAPEATSTRVIAIVASTAILVLIMALVRRRKLREEYTPIWMALAVGTVLISVSSELLRAVTRLLGAWTPSSAIFFVGELFLLLICLNYAVRLSTLVRQVKNLTQEVAILRMEKSRG